MSLVLALLVVLVILWLLGFGRFVHFNTTLHLQANFHTLLVVVLILAVLALVVRRF
jgi:hypothetical protein